MKTGYDNYFKNARKAKDPKVSEKLRSNIRTAAASSQTKDPLQSKNRNLAKELRARMQPQKAIKKKSSIQWKLATFSFVGMALTLLGLQNLDAIEKSAKRIEFSFLGKAIAEEAPKQEKKASEAGASASAPAASSPNAEAKKEFTKEEIDHFAKLNERKKELDGREAELNRVEAELQTQKVELEKRLNDLEQTRKNISQILEERVQVDDKKVETLVQMYSNMKPQQSAKVFESMDENLAIEILGRMKKKNAAEVMNLMKPEKAQIFSEKFAGYKKK